MSKKKLITLTDDWSLHPKVMEHTPPLLSQNQKDLLTPILINSSSIEGIRRSFLELFRKTNSLFSPLSFRYSYSFNVSGKRNITVVPKYYLEKDLNMMLNDYKIVTQISHIIPEGKDWEEEAYEHIKYFSGTAAQTAFKLVKTHCDDGTYRGYECKEIFKDKPVV